MEIATAHKQKECTLLLSTRHSVASVVEPLHIELVDSAESWVALRENPKSRIKVFSTSTTAYSQGFQHNTHMYCKLAQMGSLWAIFVSSVVYVYEYEGNPCVQQIFI